MRRQPSVPFRRRSRIAAIAALAGVAASVAHAQSATDAASTCQRLTDRSARLECYDRAFPPLVDSEARREAVAPSVSRPQQQRDESTPVRERREPTRDARAAAAADHARIVEVQRPNVTTTLLLAADGRVFVRTSTTSVVAWPEAPFEVDIDTSRLGNSIYLVHPITREHVRVSIRE